MTVLPFQVIEKIVDKPLRIRGIAIAAGMSRNFNIYTPEELQAFASKLVDAPVYVEHVSVESAVGKVTKTEWDGHALWYEAEIYESEIADKIRKGLIQHVSVGADYEAIDIVDGKVPHGLHNAELSLVAVPGVPEANVMVLEKLTETEAKLTEANGKLVDSENRLTEALRKVEELKGLEGSVCLVKDKPKTLFISEAVEILEALLPCPAVERSTLGMMRECQAIRSAIFKLRGRDI